MSPAIRRAAAYVYLTGWRPKGLHVTTSVALSDVTEYVTRFRRVAGIWMGGYRIREEHLADVRRDGLAVAGDALRIAGAKPETERGTSHYVAFHETGGWRGLAHRGGGGSARFDLGRRCAPFNRGAGFTDKAARAYVATSDLPAGSPIQWQAWRDLAVELCEPRYSDERKAYVEADARAACERGDSPFAYACAAHRAIMAG